MDKGALLNALINAALIVVVLVILYKKGLLKRRPQQTKAPIEHDENVTIVDFSRGNEVRRALRQGDVALLPQDSEGGVLVVRIQFFGDTSPRLRRLQRLSGASHPSEVVLDALCHYEHCLITSEQ